MVKKALLKLPANTFLCFFFLFTLLSPIAHAKTENTPSANPQSEEMSVLKQKLQSTPDDPFLHYQLGRLYLQQNKPLEAQQTFSQAIRLKRDFAEAWAGFGASSALLGKPEMALKAYDRALQLQPENQSWKDEMTAIETRLNTITVPLPTPSASPATITLTPAEKATFWESPLVPAGASLALPGAGQLYSGIHKGGDWWDIARAVLYMGVAGLSYWQISESINRGDGRRDRLLWLGSLGVVMLVAPIDAYFTSGSKQ